MKATSPSLSRSLVLMATLLVGAISVRAQQEVPVDPLLRRARDKGLEEKYTEALALYTEYDKAHPAQTQDEVQPLLEAASCASLAGQPERAFAICEHILQVPAKEGAHPPGLAPGPLDLRNEARWRMAQIRSSEERWSEALALFQQTSPHDEGCVPTGAGAQEMAIVQGECLEHLGRFDEAVALYFPAALHLDNSIAPQTMRRLFDLYQQSGQLPDLERNIARERATDEKNLTYRKLQGLPDEQIVEMRARSSVSAYERVERFKTAAQTHDWSTFVHLFQGPTVSPYSSGDTSAALALWNWREAVAVLLDLDAPARRQIVQVLTKALPQTRKTDDSTVNLGAAIAILQGPDGTYVASPSENNLIQATFGTVGSKYPSPTRKVTLPTGVKLPTEFPAVLYDYTT